MTMTGKWVNKCIIAAMMIMAMFLGYNIRCSAADMYTVSGTEKYLALRSEMAYDRSNEIGKLNNGESVEKINGGNGTYWYVYSSKLNMYGYVNSNYLVKASSSWNTNNSSGSYYMVTGTQQYLALRTEAAYAKSNEIGKLYNGETVEYVNSGTNGYWYVYSSKLGKYGYVNSDYLVKTGSPGNTNNSGNTYYEVTGTDQYLALRSAAAYDASNEIGKIYNGETVQYVNSGTNGYWYVYSSKLNKYGYVNSKYLKQSNSKPQQTVYYTVTGTDQYLALRTAAAYDSSNEIGKLYNGETVEYVNSGTNGYWYVYSAKLGKYGYVNSKYLK